MAQLKQKTDTLQDELVHNAIVQLWLKYGQKIASLEEVREITERVAKKTHKSLSESVIRVREET